MHRHASSTPDDEWYLDTSSALPSKRQHLSAAAPLSFPSAAGAAAQQQQHHQPYGSTRRHPMPPADDAKSARDASPSSLSAGPPPRGEADDEDDDDDDDGEEEPSAGTAPPSPLLTKARLLQWVSDLLGIHVFSLDQMRRGDVYLRVCGRLFPHAAPLGLDELGWAYRPTSDADVDRNVDALRAVFAALGLPRTLLLAGAAAAAAFKAADAGAHRELLVFLYAAHRMREASAGGGGGGGAASHALSMSRPVSPELLAFLQSPAMAAMVARCPVDAAASRIPSQATRPASSGGGGGSGPIGDGFEPGCVVECVGMTTQAELNGVRGVCVAVEGGGGGVEAGRVQVELPPPHGRMLVFAGCLRVVRAARGCPGVGDEVKVLRVARAAALSPQERRRSAEACGAGADGVVEAVTRDAAGGAVLRVRVRVGGGGGAELAVWTHAEHVEPLLRGRYGQSTCVEPPPALVGGGGGGGGGGGSFHSGAFRFSSPAQVSDELERLSIENSLLRARLEAAERARQGAASSIAAFAMKMRLAFEADLTLERNGHALREREQAAHAESQLAALRQQHATDMAEAKAAWAATVAASAAAAAAAAAADKGDGEAAGGSASLQHQHHRLLDALSNDPVLEKANASLHALAARYEATAAEEAERSRAAYASCRGILRALLTTDAGGRRVGAAAAEAEAEAGKQEESPILALLRGKGVGVGEDAVLRDALGAYVTHGAHPAGVVNDILTLAVRVKELVEDREQLEAERDAAEGRAAEQGFMLGAGGGEELPAEQQQQPPAGSAAVAPPTPLLTPHILLSDVGSSFTSTAPPPFPAADTASGAAGAGATAEARRSGNLLSVVGSGQRGGGGGGGDVGTERKTLLSALTGSSAHATKWLTTHEAEVAAVEGACNLRSSASGLPAQQKSEAAPLPRLSGNIMDDIDLVRRHMSGHPSQPAKKPAAARTDTLFS